MKKEVKGIIGLGAVLVVLGGGLAALKLTAPSDDKNSSEVIEMPSQENVGSGIILVQDSDELPGTAPVLDADGLPIEPEESKVSKLHVKNEECEYDILVSENENGDKQYALEGYEDVDIDSALLSTLVFNLNGVESASFIEEDAKDLDKFGLAEPRYTGEMTYASGRVKKYYVGIKNPADTSVSYFRVEGSNNVYTIANSKIANYSKNPKDFINKTLVEKPNKEDLPDVEKLVIERKDIDYNIVLDYNARLADGKSGGSTAVHEMTEPVKSYLTVEKSSEVTHGIFGLTADEVYAVHCTDKDISDAGLKDPFCRAVVTIEDGGGEYTLLFSEIKTDEGDKDDASDDKKYCYMMLEGGKVIYTIDPEKAKWVTIMPIDIASRIIMGCYVWNIDTLEISCNTGDKASFVVTPKDSTIDRYGTKAEDYDVTKDGKAFDAERYRQLVAYLISINGESFAFDEKKPEGEPMVSFKLYDGYNKEEHTYEFYDYSLMNVIIVVDGDCRFFGSKSNVKTLIENIKKIDTNEDFVTTWS